ncbi:MAG: hypothetical protein EXQ55_05275 [Acidobacteria bacterium]|nr:hypothetical protein [Acidobacteriota bacterium]
MVHAPESLRRLALAGSVLAWAVSSPALPAAQSDELSVILSALAERTQQYYGRFISIICTETVTQQELKSNLAPTGRPRVTVYELSVSRDQTAKSESNFLLGRTLQSVNGRPARRNQQPECTDPKTGTPEPLRFLLAANQTAYRFTLAANATGGPAGTRAVDFVETPPERVRITWNGNCFNAEGGGHAGRLWFDPATFDVLQVEVRLGKPFLVPMPAAYFGLVSAIRVEQSEATLRLARVNFTQPDETAILPESIDTLTVFRGAPSLRTSQRLSNFRRFLSESSIRSPAF